MSSVTTNGRARFALSDASFATVELRTGRFRRLFLRTAPEVLPPPVGMDIGVVDAGFALRRRLTVCGGVGGGGELDGKVGSGVGHCSMKCHCVAGGEWRRGRGGGGVGIMLTRQRIAKATHVGYERAVQ